MRYVILLNIMMLFAVSLSFSLDGRSACGAVGSPVGTEQAVNKSSGKAGGAEETPGTQIAGAVPHQSAQPIADTSNDNRVVSISEILPRLDHSFLEENPDVEWSRPAEQKLQDLFRPLINKSTSLTSVQCRTTLCRVEFLHVTEEGFRNFLQSLKTASVTREWKGEGVGGKIRTTDAEGVRSVFYLAKPGASLLLETPAQGNPEGRKGSADPALVNPVK